MLVWAGLLLLGSLHAEAPTVAERVQTEDAWMAGGCAPLDEALLMARSLDIPGGPDTPANRAGEPLRQVEDLDTPKQNLRGTYGADVSGEGENARVTLYGRIDTDGDSRRAEYVYNCSDDMGILFRSQPGTY